jgi:hypothetical protein
MGAMSSGNPASLEPYRKGNTFGAKSGIRSVRLREPRAREIAAELMQAGHITPLDALTVAQVARTEALIEVIETELAKVSSRNGRRMKWLAELQLRAINRQTELLRELGMTPRSRAEWLRDVAAGESLAESIQRRREARERARALERNAP